jgi:uncharacterized cupin superfamily protein
MENAKEILDFAKKIEEIFKKDLEANMIKVKKAGEAERKEMEANPIWECGVSEFDWHYDSEETCLLLEGAVEVSYDGGSVSFGTGDYVVFPKGLDCVWKVSKPVKKHYVFK